MHLPRTFLESTGLMQGLPAIFVHTPKCGGSFIAEGLGRRRERHCFTRKHPLLKGHRTWREYRDLFPQTGRDLGDFMTFSVVRNPWQWHVSIYHYVRQMTGRYAQIYAAEHGELNRITFSDYLAMIDDSSRKQIGGLEEYTRNVCDWLVDDQDRIAVDFLMRQERMEEDFTRFTETYDLRLSIPAKRVNTSKHYDYRTYYSDQDAELVQRRHARDVAHFGYGFDG
jgi:hypothetical protein